MGGERVISVETTKRVPIAKLKRYPRNPRKGDVAAIVESLKAHGQYRALVVSKRTNEVLAGNHTFLALQELGEDEALVHFVDVDDEEAKRIVLVDNRSNDLAGYDDAALLELLQSLPDLAGTGFADDSLAKLVEHVEHVEFDASTAEIPETYEVIVTLNSESEQVTLLERLAAEGLECRALLS